MGWGQVIGRQQKAEVRSLAPRPPRRLGLEGFPEFRNRRRVSSGASRVASHRSCPVTSPAARTIATMPARIASGRSGQRSMIACKSASELQVFVSTAPAAAPAALETSVFPGDFAVCWWTENPCVGGSIPPLTIAASRQ